MKIEKTDITWLVILALILTSFLFFFIQITQIKAQIQNAALVNTVQAHSQNFQMLDKALTNMNQAITELKLANKIQGNIIESGPIKK